MSDRPAGSAPRIAIVGCGAVAAGMHIPALKRAGLTPSALFDADHARAVEVAREAGESAAVCPDLAAVADHADAAIVAVPHRFHAEIACELMDLGVDVLVEKPMAPTVAECERMNSTAARTGRVLEVGLMRRHAPAAKWLADLVHDGVLGQIESVDIREGFVFNWPVASPAFFSGANGGVLKDTGAHTLDLLAWLLPTARVESYADDAAGGVEADCSLELADDLGVQATVELSRTRQMRNSVVVLSHRGTIEVDIFGGFITGSRELVFQMTRRARGADLVTRRIPDLFDAQLAAWVRAVRREEPPVVGGVEAIRSVALMEQCAGVRRAFQFPWEATR